MACVDVSGVDDVNEKGTVEGIDEEKEKYADASKFIPNVASTPLNSSPWQRPKPLISNALYDDVFHNMAALDISETWSQGEVEVVRQRLSQLLHFPLFTADGHHGSECVEKEVRLHLVSQKRQLAFLLATAQFNGVKKERTREIHADPNSKDEQLHIESQSAKVGSDQMNRKKGAEVVSQEGDPDYQNFDYCDQE
jgi:hypothetical protein